MKFFNPINYLLKIKKSSFFRVTVGMIVVLIITTCSKQNEDVFNGVFSDGGRLASVNTVSVTNITDSSVTMNGELIYIGNSKGLAIGFCWSTQENPTIESDSVSSDFKQGPYSLKIEGLIGNTHYFSRAFAKSNLGTAYGKQIEFETKAVPPIVVTSDIKIYTYASAIVGVVVVSDGGEDVIEHGVFWSKTATSQITGNKIVIGAGIGEFSYIITQLEADTKYYVVGYAINSVGINFGEEVSFTTYGVVNDFDNNNYNTIKIGSQIWMKENLKTTKYNDGSSIPNVSSQNSWINLNLSKAGAYCWYDNNIINKNVYGALYNYFAVEDSRKLCPSGWHVPNYNEWAELINYLGGDYYSGGKMKDTTLWDSPNAYATNSSSFTAFPGGMRSSYVIDNGFDKKGHSGYWWSSTLYNESKAWVYRLIFDDSYIYYYYIDKNLGYSVRCIKDE